MHEASEKFSHCSCNIFQLKRAANGRQLNSKLTVSSHYFSPMILVSRAEAIHLSASPGEEYVHTYIYAFHELSLHAPPASARVTLDSNDRANVTNDDTFPRAVMADANVPIGARRLDDNQSAFCGSPLFVLWSLRRHKQWLGSTVAQSGRVVSPHLISAGH